MLSIFLLFQQHIDALYDYIDKLQHSKADKDDINSEMDVKADKHALDGKVSKINCSLRKK